MVVVVWCHQLVRLDDLMHTIKAGPLVMGGRVATPALGLVSIGHRTQFSTYHILRVD
jgi:hypothetical protein